MFCWQQQTGLLHPGFGLASFITMCVLWFEVFVGLALCSFWCAVCWCFFVLSCLFCGSALCFTSCENFKFVVVSEDLSSLFVVHLFLSLFCWFACWLIVCLLFCLFSILVFLRGSVFVCVFVCWFIFVLFVGLVFFFSWLLGLKVLFLWYTLCHGTYV